MTYGRGYVQQLPSGRWRARVPDGQGGHKSLGSFATKEEAERELDVAAVVREERHVGQTFAAYGELVIGRWRQAGKRSTRSDESRWRQLVAARAEWAQQPVDGITRGEVRDWVRGLLRAKGERGRFSSQTIRHALNLVRRVFAEALEDELIDINPAMGLKPPRRSDEQCDAWTALSSGEVSMLLLSTHLTAEQRAAYSLAIYTGLRQGELAALRWDDVRNLDGGAPHLIVSRSWTTTTKTGRTRVVYLIPVAAEVLRRCATQNARPRQRSGSARTLAGSTGVGRTRPTSAKASRGSECGAASAFFAA
jgi:integrase